MSIILNNMEFIAAGLAMTFALAAVTLIFSSVIAFVMGALSVTRFRSLRWAVRCYVEFFRDIPLIVNTFFVFFGAPIFGLDLSPFTSVTVSLSLWGGANGAEIVRGGFSAVPIHQWNSGVALGLKRWEVFAFIIGPQALKAIIPPYVGLLVILILSTSVGALVGVTEFFKVGQLIVERTTLMEGWNPSFIVYSMVLLVYFLICSTMTHVSRRLERRLNQDRKPTASRNDPEQILQPS